MKKLIYCALALAAGLFASSCQQENLEPVAQGNTVTFTVNVPGAATKAGAVGDQANMIDDLVYAVYVTEAESLDDAKDDWDGTNTKLLYAYNSESKRFENGTDVVSLELLNNQNHIVLLWAQHDDTWVREKESAKINLREISYPSGLELDAEYADKYAAFYAVKFIPSSERLRNGEIVLTRPFAQINIATADPGKYNVDVEKTVVTVYGAGNAFDVAKEQPAGNIDVTYSWTGKVYDDAFKVDGHDYDHYIAMNYVFANDAVEVKYTIDTDYGKGINRTISNVPVKKNYRTNIVGNLLTSDVYYDIVLDKDWGTEDTDYEYVVLDGITYISIATAKDLQYFANQVNAGDPEWINANVLLANDIDLSELAQTRSTTAYWTPISMSTDLANGKTYRGIFNGNGKSIKNMVCKGTEVAGLFGYLYAATIKNVTIENATINSNHFAAGIVAWVNNLKGNIQMPFVIENCHVVNSTITSIPEQVNGEWDNGDKVGGLVGAAWFKQGSELNEGTKIANSSVDNTTIKAYRDFGGLVGYAQGVNIENCSTNGVTLEQDLTHDYKAPNTPDTFGLTIGNNAGDNKIDGNAYVADGIAKDKDGNYYIHNAAGLKWVADEVNKYSNYERPFEGVTLKLMNDIDLGGMEWTPIGDYRFSANRFCGTFDGQNHTISNFKITKKTDKDDSNKSSYGFFGNLEGTVKNLTIADATVNSYAYTGALAGRLNQGLIQNCHAINCNVSNTYWQGGILIGQVNGISSVVKDCTVKNSSVTSKSAIGAIAGPVTADQEKNGVIPDGEIIFENCQVKNCEVKQEGSFGGSYDKYFGSMFGYLEATKTNVDIKVINCTSEQTTVKGNLDAPISGDIDGNVYIDGSLVVATEKAFTAALEAGKNMILTADIYLSEPIQVTDKTFAINGNGYKIGQSSEYPAEGTATTALIHPIRCIATIENVVFDGLNVDGPLRTVDTKLTISNVTVVNCKREVTGSTAQGLFRLHGESTISNCVFRDNTCPMAISLNWDGNNELPQSVKNCVFENNTCISTAVLYYVKGSMCEVDGNKFIGNNVTVSGGSNAATVYMGFTENNVITNNVFQNNTVNVGTSKRVAGGLMIGYDAVITGNAFVGNTVNGENAKGNDVCASVYYTDINLSGNYWGGNAPVEDEDYFVEYPDRHNVIINDYLTVNPFNN